MYRFQSAGSVKSEACLMYPLNNDGEYLKDTNSLFETSFAEYPFNYKKNFDAR